MKKSIAEAEVSFCGDRNIYITYHASRAEYDRLVAEIKQSNSYAFHLIAPAYSELTGRRKEDYGGEMGGEGKVMGLDFYVVLGFDKMNMTNKAAFAYLRSLAPGHTMTIATKVDSRKKRFTPVYATEEIADFCRGELKDAVDTSGNY